jgi:hypothetical protein
MHSGSLISMLLLCAFLAFAAGFSFSSAAGTRGTQPTSSITDTAKLCSVAPKGTWQTLQVRVGKMFHYWGSYCGIKSI